MKTSSVQHVMENWCRQEVRWLRGRGGVGGKREGCVGGVTDEARERRGSWSRALWVGILSAGEVGIGGQSGMHAHVSHASVSATMQRPTKWVKGGLNTAPVWSYEWGYRRAADNLKPASTGSFTVLWACQRAAPCLGFEGTEEEGKGGFSTETPAYPKSLSHTQNHTEPLASYRCRWDDKRGRNYMKIMIRTCRWWRGKQMHNTRLLSWWRRTPKDSLLLSYIYHYCQ